jgi:hypothetical protein
MIISAPYVSVSQVWKLGEIMTQTLQSN